MSGAARDDARRRLAARACPRAFAAPPAQRLLRWRRLAGSLAWLRRRAVVVRHHARSGCANGLRASASSSALMIPPSPGEHWDEILQALAQSVAMAFLGTFIAALVAVPLGFLGARQHRDERAVPLLAAPRASTASAASTS